jgi:hypothetical protein
MQWISAPAAASPRARQRQDMIRTPSTWRLRSRRTRITAQRRGRVGVLLFFLVTGDFPVYARSVHNLRTAHRYGDRQFLTEVRPDLPAAFVRVVGEPLLQIPEAISNRGSSR